MKILMVLDSEFPPDIRVENEIESLLKYGHNVDIACFTRKGKPAKDNFLGATVFRKSISDFIYKSSVAALTLPFYFNFWRKYLDKIILENGYDAIHIHDLPLIRVAYELKQKYGIKLTSDLHENWPAYLKISAHTNTFLGKILSPIFLWRRYEKKYLKTTDNIVVVVEEAKERIHELVGRKKVSVVSNTINTNELPDLEAQNDNSNLVLFYAGGITYHRGLQTIIKGMGNLNNSKSVEFWIFGEGRYKKELEKLVESLNLSSNVKFFGYVPYKQMLGYMAKCDISVIPHVKSEHTDSTIPHKLFQYMYYKKPVITSNCLPIERIVNETNSGYSYDWDKPNQFSDIIYKIAQNLEEISEKGENGYQWVMKKYNWEIDSGILNSIYEL